MHNLVKKHMFKVAIEKVEEHLKVAVLIILGCSLVVSDLCSKNKGSRLESGH